MHVEDRNASLASRPGWSSGVGAASLLAVLGGLLLPGGASAFPLDAAQLEQSGRETVLRIDAQSSPEKIVYEVFCLEDPDRVVVDIYGADFPVPIEEKTVGPVTEVRSSWRDGSVRSVRYVLQTRDPVDYYAESDGTNLTVHLVPGTGKEAKGDSTSPTIPLGESPAPLWEPDVSANGATPEATPVEAATEPADSAEAGDAGATGVMTGSASPAVSTDLATDGASAAGESVAAESEGAAGTGQEPAPAARSNTSATDGSGTGSARTDSAFTDLGSGSLDSDAETLDGDAETLESDTETPDSDTEILDSELGSPESDATPAGTGAGTVSSPTNGSSTVPSPAGDDWWTEQDAAPPLAGGVDAATPPRPPDPLSGSGAAAASIFGQTEPMSLDVHDADLRTVFRSIAEFGGINVVPDRDVIGPVSIKLVDVPWRQALDIVCQSAGLIATENGPDVIRVATLKTFREEGLENESNARKKEEFMPLSTHVFTAGYAAASELVDAVSLVLSERGSVHADSRTNSVVVTDIDQRIDEVGKLIRSLDTETEQVEIVAKLVDVDATASRQFGIDWSLENLSNSSAGLSGSAEVSERLLQKSGQLRFGVVRGWGNLDATLETLENTNKAHIISNPKITTVNNHAARILVGKEIPLITLDERGNPITELKKVGITLEVTPFINKEDRVTMDMHPEISDLSSQATVQGGLIFTTSEADTRIMVNDGQTAVIGGLIRTNETKFEQGIPVLKSIPFLGALFRQSDTRTEERELLIFVTPHVVRDVASSTN